MRLAANFKEFVTNACRARAGPPPVVEVYQADLGVREVSAPEPADDRPRGGRSR